MCKGFSENWLCPDSHASSQHPRALSQLGVPMAREDWMKA